MKKGNISINVNDIIGKRLGKLEVLSYSGRWYDNTKGGLKMRHSYLCKCDCGNYKHVRRSQLVGEIIHSCGCSKRGLDSR